MSALSEVVVVETATGVAGPYCGKLLADYGARVIKVEPAGGDVTRHAGPFAGGRPNPDASGLFLHLNTGKQSVALGADSSANAKLVRSLLARADLLIDDHVLADLDLGVESLREANPHLVIARLQHGTEAGGGPANDLTVYATSGWMAPMGRPGGPPVYPGQDYPYYAAGLYAFFGSVSALIHARRSGQGQVVDVSAVEAAISIGFYDTTRNSYGMPVRPRRGSRLNGIAASAQPCRDGWVAMTVGANREWQRLCAVLQAPELAEGDYSTPQKRLDNQDRLEAELRARLAGWSVADLVREAQEGHVAVSPLSTTRDIYRSAQLRARDWFAAVDHPEAGRVEHPGLPYRFSGMAGRIRPAPKHGADQEDVRSWLAPEGRR